MHRLRSTWLALMGGALLIALSVSTAFGAPPNEKDTRGQKVSSFVHELIFGSDEETDEDEVVDEDPADEDGDGSEDDEDETTDDDEVGSEDDEDADEDVDEVDEDGEETADRQVPEEFANHGECVSEATQDTEGYEESEAANKGEWVSMHARYVCWGLEVPGEDSDEDATDEDATDDEEEDADDEDADEASAREQAKADRAAARAERKAERAAARQERKAAQAAARAERQVARAANRGGGKGRGGH